METSWQTEFTSAEKESQEDSQSSRKHCSQEFQRALKIVAQGCCDNSDPLTAQKADLIQCNKDGFLAAANQAGIDIYGIFIPDDMASLSTMMPPNFIAELKLMFQGAFGSVFHIFEISS